MSAPPEWPGWVIFHVPHDSTWIPDEVRDQFALDDRALQDEILRMTDHHTLELFASGVSEGQVVRSPVSRLVVDVERFEDDRLEPMAALGMGAVYTRTSSLGELRRPLTWSEREKLIRDWYRPHHDRLTRATDAALAQYGRALLIDCHSFPSRPLPYEFDQRPNRPQICIGTDPFHTPETLTAALVGAFEAAGMSTWIDAPFSGSLVPAPHHAQDKRVASVMVEVNRAIYMDEATGARLDGFDVTASLVSICIRDAIGFLNHPGFSRHL